MLTSSLDSALEWGCWSCMQPYCIENDMIDYQYVLFYSAFRFTPKCRFWSKRFFFLLTNRQFCVPVCGNVKFYMWIINCASTVCKLFLIKLWISPHSALFILCVSLICWRWWKMPCFVVMSWISAKRWGDWTLNIITCFVGNVPKKKYSWMLQKGNKMMLLLRFTSFAL